MPDEFVTPCIRKDYLPTYLTLQWFYLSLVGGARGRERTDFDQTNASHFRFHLSRMKSCFSN